VGERAPTDDAVVLAEQSYITEHSVLAISLTRLHVFLFVEKDFYNYSTIIEINANP
jgi:hypothetical protein